MTKGRLQVILQSIKSIAEKLRTLSDEELQRETPRLKQCLLKGKSTEQILPEAYAAMCEADRRILGKFPYDVQIEGAIALHYGYLAEMNTGEGKTLTATLPLYLNALTGKSTILVTANEYLAFRDANEMRPAFAFMGLTERNGAPQNPGDFLTNEDKRQNYAADILYTTHGVLAFDYLLNNLVKSAEERFLRDFYFIIIDEADSVLLDAAQMPLVISGSPRVQSNLYAMADFFVSTLKEDLDYETEDKAVWLTERGVTYAEKFFGIDAFFSHENFEINRHVILALRAHVLFELQKDYVLADDGEIVLLDNSTGRSLPGMKLRGGAHQALEQKEHVKLSQEQRSVASVTYQNLFLMFPRMCGMSGTISDAKGELRKVYHKKVMIISPHKKLVRIDFPDQYFETAEEQYKAALEETLTHHATGQPVLVVAATIHDTQVFSRMLVENHIPHSVLNANNAFWEAEIIAAAGQKDAVTVSTSMAGRGTDIKLADEVEALGGLAVIGIGRMENIRLERQARGRAGRQGNPGSSRFYVSLEDETVTAINGKKANEWIESRRQTSRRRLRRLINGSQRILEEQGASTREQAVRYDEILRRQREIFYEARDRLLGKETISKQTMLGIIKDNLECFLRETDEISFSILKRYVLDNLSYEREIVQDVFHEGNYRSRRKLLKNMIRLADRLYDEKEASFPNAEVFQEYIRHCVLQALDEEWVEEIDYLQQLQYAITTRGTAQRNPIFEYSREAYQAFTDMKSSMKKKITRNFYLGDVQFEHDGKMDIVFP